MTNSSKKHQRDYEKLPRGTTERRRIVGGQKEEGGSFLLNCCRPYLPSRQKGEQKEQDVGVTRRSVLSDSHEVSSVLVAQKDSYEDPAGAEPPLIVDRALTCIGLLSWIFPLLTDHGNQPPGTTSTCATSRSTPGAVLGEDGLFRNLNTCITSDDLRESRPFPLPSPPQKWTHKEGSNSHKDSLGRSEDPLYL